MRSQIQRGAEHLGSADVVAADASRGVTAVEFEQIGMLGALADYRRAPARNERLPRRPVGNEPNILGAFVRQSIMIRQSIIPGGVILGGDINPLRQTFPDSETRAEVRVDAENLFGHNLRFPQ